MNSTLQTIILSTLGIQIKHIRWAFLPSYTQQIHREFVVFVQHRGIGGGIPLNTRPRKNTGNKWRETFHENQHIGEPLNWLWALELTSCPVRYQAPHHLAGSEQSGVVTHTHTCRTCTHIRVRESRRTWRRLACRREWPVLPCLVCSCFAFQVWQDPWVGEEKLPASW